MENNTAGSGSMVAVFAQLEDPRVADGQRHRPCAILVIAFCTVLCGQEEFTAMARFGKAKEAWLRGFLELPFGIPSHDTFRTVLSALDSKQLAQALIDWTQSVREKLGRPEIVAIDGKSARRSVSKGAKAALHLVNAWAVDNGLCLGQEQTSEKSNEITAVPLLLRQLEPAGCIVTVDALNPPKAIAREIRQAAADYVLALQGQPPTLAPGGQRLLARCQGARLCGCGPRLLRGSRQGPRTPGDAPTQRSRPRSTGLLRVRSGRACVAWEWWNVSAIPRRE